MYAHMHARAAIAWQVTSTVHGGLWFMQKNLMVMKMGWTLWESNKSMQRRHFFLHPCFSH